MIEQYMVTTRIIPYYISELLVVHYILKKNKQ